MTVMQTREHFGIVGGGLLGLTLALRLVQRGYRVTLLEAAITWAGWPMPGSLAM